MRRPEVRLLTKVEAKVDNKLPLLCEQVGVFSPAGDATGKGNPQKMEGVS